MSSLTVVDLQQLVTMLVEQGLSPRTVRYSHAVLHSALKQAVVWRLLADNPAQYVELPRQTRREMRALSPEEAREFLTAANRTRWGILFELALVTGMRPGELLALKWQDIDWEHGTVRVARSLVRRSSEWTFTEPKTARARRSIPIPKDTLGRLAAHRRAQVEMRLAGTVPYVDNDLVFAGEGGQPLDEHNLVRRYFKPLLKTAGLPEQLRLYGLRHTAASLLLAQGTNPKIVSERLGHASVVLTLDTYSHVLPSLQEEATERLGGLLFGPS